MNLLSFASLVRLSCLVLALSCCLAGLSRADTYSEKISATQICSPTIVWVGEKPPSEQESKQLWEAIEGCRAQSCEGNLEGFLQQFPQSGWAPSVRAHLAQSGRRRGRYTMALNQWELAWVATKHFTNGSGKATADFTLAYWSQLLASLGRQEKLAEVFRETEHRTLDNPEWQSLFAQSRDGYYTMTHYPGISYRCGTFALNAVGKALNETNVLLNRLFDVPSPTNGFSMTKLVEMADEYQLGLTPVERRSGTNIVIPSIVHWRQDHYAAIIKQDGPAYWVVDPTFGHGRWMLPEVINEEASGSFLLPKSKVPADWKLLTKAETDRVFGKGQPNHMNNWQDEGCDRSPGGPGAPLATSTNPGGNMSVCIPCQKKGMPVWWVSEPYINLHIADTPLFYTTSFGTEWSFRWSYSQRDVYDDPSSGFCSLPAHTVRRSKGLTNSSWSHNWLSHVRFRDAHYDQLFPFAALNYHDWEALVYLPDGGVRYHSVDSQTEKRSKSQLIPLSASGFPTSNVPSIPQFTNGLSLIDNSTDGFKLVYPDGSEDYYNLTVESGNCNGVLSQVDALLTKRIDPQGRASFIIYETGTNGALGTSYVLRPKYVIDHDGATNVFTYSTAAQKGDDLLSVTNAAGAYAQFAYSSDGKLTNITDAVGLPSGFGYQSGGANSNWITTLVTPYGTNYFFHYEDSSSQSSTNQDNAGGHDRVNRYIQVIEPDWGFQVFMYRYDSPRFVPDSYPTSSVPVLPSFASQNFDNGTATSTAPNASLHFRNTFYWGKKQTAAIYTGPLSYSTNEYLLARMRHWLDAIPNGSTPVISDRISLERAHSPDGVTEGQLTWFDYEGKDAASRHRIGSESRLGTIAVVLPDGTTRFTQSLYLEAPGYPGTVYSSHTATDGTTAYRTNAYTYAANGIDLKRVSFADGSSENFGYNSLHQVTFYTNAASEVTSLTYLESRLTTVTQANGFGTVFSYYGGFGALQSISQPQISRTTTFTWSAGNPVTITDARGLITTNTWDGLNRLTSTRYQTDGTFISNRYDKLDLFATKDRLDNWTYFGHDRMQRLTVVTNANTNKTWFAYCGCGSLEAITNSLLETNIFTYDLQLRGTSVMLGDGSTLTYRYDPLGRVTNILDGANRTWTLGYNNQGLLASVSNAFGQVNRIVYDIRDRPVQVTDAAGVTVTNTFDALNRLLSRAYPDNGIERFVYNTSGLIAHTNQLGAITRYGYDVAGRLNAITNAITASTEVTRFTYSAASDLLSLVVDGKNQTNIWNYDVFGRVTNKVDATGQTVFGFSYDANDRLTNRWTPAKGGINTRFTYDPVGNLRSINYPNTGIAFEYDALNRVQQMSNAAGVSAFIYSKAGQLASEDGPWTGDTITNVYAQLLRTSSTLGTTWTNSYLFDAARRLTNVTSGAGNFGYQFAAASELRNKVTLPSGAFITNVFDQIAQLTNTTLFNSSLSSLNSHSYLYDQWGQRTNARLTTVGGTSPAKWDYTYDPIGQLKSALPYDTNNALITAQRLGYAYDAAGNLHYRTNDVLVRNFVTDNLNQLTNVAPAGVLTVNGVTTTNATNVTVNGLGATLNGDGTYTRANVPVGNGTNALTAIGYELYGRRATNVVIVGVPVLQYDANGNLLFDGKKGFWYDDENQLTSIVVTNVWKSEFVYDGFGRRRIRKEFTWTGGTWSQTNEVRYVFDGLLPIQERDSSNNPKVNYTRGIDLSGGMRAAGGIGGLLARTDASGSAYYHSDGNGNVTALINSSQTFVANYSYDPFGNVLSAAGSLAPVNEMQFSSMPKHAQSGLNFYAFRPYSPGLQRFIQADPIGIAGGLNIHGFVGNRPVNSYDPLGLEMGMIPPEYGQSPEFREGFDQGMAEPFIWLGKGLGWALDELDAAFTGTQQWLRQRSNPFLQNLSGTMELAMWVGGGGETKAGIKLTKRLKECKDVAKTPKLASNLEKEAKLIRNAGKYDTTVGSLDEARGLIRSAFPDAVELPPAVAGQPYPSPPPGVKQWFQVQPAEPSVGNKLPHIKYADWTGGKKGSGGSWGHIFFPNP